MDMEKCRWIQLHVQDESTGFADDLDLRGRYERVKELAKKMPRFFCLENLRGRGSLY